ncbi:hypothetical protein CONLIGDRAFT_581605, partial [Coniochaeta ligniaria NRRL 30616]
TDEEFQKVVAWLSSLNFASRHADFLSRQQAGTGEWLLSDPKFQNWNNGNESTLWCPGLPGAGKTTLASMVIHWLESRYQDPNTAVIYMFCSYKEEDTQTPEHLMASLLKQILQHKAVLPEDVRRLYQTHINRNTRPGLEEITPLLVQEVKTCSDVFVVIDALDECSDREDKRARLLDGIQKLPPNSHILITSRYSPKIEESFKDVPQIDIQATNDDVKRYVQGRIAKEPKLAKHVRSDPTLMDDIIATVVDNCKGM